MWFDGDGFLVVWTFRRFYKKAWRFLSCQEEKKKKIGRRNPAPSRTLCIEDASHTWRGDQQTIHSAFALNEKKKNAKESQQNTHRLRLPRAIQLYLFLFF